MKTKTLAEPKRPLDLDTITITRETHPTRGDGSQLSLLEACAFCAGEPHGDQPRSVCRAVAAFVRALVDFLPETELQKLRSFIPRLAASVSDSVSELKRRAFVVASIGSCYFDLARAIRGERGPYGEGMIRWIESEFDATRVFEALPYGNARRAIIAAWRSAQNFDNAWTLETFIPILIESSQAAVHAGADAFAAVGQRLGALHSRLQADQEEMEQMLAGRTGLGRTAAQVLEAMAVEPEVVKKLIAACDEMPKASQEALRNAQKVVMKAKGLAEAEAWTRISGIAFVGLERLLNRETA